MLPLLLLSSIAVCNAAPVSQCDASRLTIVGGSVTLNSETGQAMFSCPSGKYPHPGPTRDCLWSGRWSSEEQAECRDVECPRIIEFDNGEYFPWQKKYVAGDVLHFRCHEGYEMKNWNTTRTCQANGKWSGKTTICDDNEGHCPDPGIPIGTTKAGKFHDIASKVSYECQRELKMFGSQERICQEDKTWSGSEPSCRYWYTYDTPKEVAEDFGASLAETIESSDPNRVEVKGDRKLHIKKGGPMNIFIIIDASKSVESVNFDIAKESAEVFINKISSYDFTPRYSILTYASDIKTIITLSDDENTDLEKVIGKLKNFSYEEHKDKGGTNTRGALLEVLNQLSLDLLRQKDAFYEASNIILLMTDGKHNMGGSPTVEVERIRYMLKINENRENKLDIYVFGLGQDPSQEELNGIASKKNNERHVFQMEDILDMKLAFDYIIDETEAFGMCGISKDDSEEVAEKFPWIARIEIARSTKPEKCKGSVISKNFILTAAHCFRLDDPLHAVNVYVVTNGMKTSVKVKAIHRHPSYNPDGKKDKNIKKSYDFDFALLELDRKLQFSSTLRPICLPCTAGASWALKLRGKTVDCVDHKNLLLNGEMVKSMFVTEENRPGNFVQKDVTIKQGNKRLDCLEDAKKAAELKDIPDITDIVTDNFLCTGGTQPQVNHRPVKVGVISWGTEVSCTDYVRNRVPNNARDFQASVFSAIDWIKEITKDDLTYL